MEGIGLGAVKAMLVPLIVVFTATPLIVMATLLLVAAFMARRLRGWWRSGALHP